MILGISVSILISLIIGLSGGIVYGCVYETITERIAISVTVLLILATLVFGGVTGYSFENAGIEKDYYGYLAVKQTYETAVIDEKLTGLERLEITKVAMEQNKEIARLKVDMGKWYSFAITGENKALILSLEPIE